MKTSPVAVHHLRRPEGTVAYEIAGAGGPLVICIPGMGDLRSAYRFTVTALADAGYRAVAVDLRGHGDSSAEFTAYGDQPTAEDVAALIQTLGGPAVLVGNSLGAAVGVLVAQQHPELVAGLALLGPFVRNPPTSVFGRAMVKVVTARPWASAMWKAYLPKLYAGRKPDDFAAHRRAIADSLRRPGHAGALARTMRADHSGAEQALPQVHVPTLVVMGALDPDFTDPAAEAKWIAAHIGGGATVVEVPEAGHYPQSQRPDVVNPALSTFLDRVFRHA